MARAKRNYIRLKQEQEKKAIMHERDEVAKMVRQFNRKNIHDTYWHKTLVRLDAALKELEGEQQNG